ncbi:hypothetical protein LIS82_07875 [Cytobacillus solani]|uniref:hypothetical protein n=1 Tax=Cytobacillus solani TaxID=1637975 RepID=UPI0020793025|nr:hypothetical protein [Cytobacillus solani]USK56379.1 hypothetical protein LIS82_07875 [Cytobacillus solani]
MFGRSKKQKDEFFPETNDIVIVFDDDNKSSDIQRIDEIREGVIYVTGKYAIPIDDCQITTGAEGRNFFYKAPAESVFEVQRLAALEQTLVLTQITAYRPPMPPAAMDWTKGLLFGLVFIAFIVMGLSSCGGGA